MATNSQIAFNPQGKPVVVAATAGSPAAGIPLVAGTATTVYITPGEGL